MSFKGLFIGIDRYASPGVNWLSCARRDAAALHGLFANSIGITAVSSRIRASMASCHPGARFDGSAVAACEEVFRSILEGLGTRHEEPEGIGQPTDHIE